VDIPERLVSKAPPGVQSSLNLLSMDSYALLGERSYGGLFLVEDSDHNTSFRQLIQDQWLDGMILHSRWVSRMSYSTRVLVLETKEDCFKQIGIIPLALAEQSLWSDGDVVNEKHLDVRFERRQIRLG